jgi:hypothetical protein
MEIRIDGFKNSNASIVHLSTHSSPQGKSMEFFVSIFQMDKFAKQMPSMYTPQRCTTWINLFIWLIFHDTTNEILQKGVSMDKRLVFFHSSIKIVERQYSITKCLCLRT